MPDIDRNIYPPPLFTYPNNLLLYADLLFYTGILTFILHVYESQNV
jgi:hypothetical protein